MQEFTVHNVFKITRFTDTPCISNVESQLHRCPFCKHTTHIKGSNKYTCKIIEREYNGTVHQLFVDFKKAYDSVWREVLYSILIEFGVAIRHLLVSDHSGWGNYEINVYLYGLYHTFHLNTFSSA
jgi:ribosomal protein L37AE/L43A